MRHKDFTNGAFDKRINEIRSSFHSSCLCRSRCSSSHHTSWKSYDNISLPVYLHPGPGVTPCHETLKSQNNWVAGDNKIFYYILTTNKGRWKSRKIRNLGETYRSGGLCVQNIFPCNGGSYFSCNYCCDSSFLNRPTCQEMPGQPGRRRVSQRVLP